MSVRTMNQSSSFDSPFPKLESRPCLDTLTVRNCGRSAKKVLTNEEKDTFDSHRIPHKVEEGLSSVPPGVPEEFDLS